MALTKTDGSIFGCTNDGSKSKAVYPYCSVMIRKNCDIEAKRWRLQYLQAVSMLYSCRMVSNICVANVCQHVKLFLSSVSSSVDKYT